MKPITINKIEFTFAENGTVTIQPSNVYPVDLANASRKLLKRLHAMERRAEAKRKEAAKKASRKAAAKARKGSKGKGRRATPKPLEQIPMPLAFG